MDPLEEPLKEPVKEPLKEPVNESLKTLRAQVSQVLGKPDPRCKLRHTDFVEMLGSGFRYLVDHGT